MGFIKLFYIKAKFKIVDFKIESFVWVGKFFIMISTIFRAKNLIVVVLF